MSRAQWLAFGPLALAGCSERFPTIPSGDVEARLVEAAAAVDVALPEADAAEMEAAAAVGAIASEAGPAEDAGADTLDAEAGLESSPDDSSFIGAHVDGGFVCIPSFPSSPPAVCDPATQYCMGMDPYGLNGRGCYAFDAGPYPISPGCPAVTCACWPKGQVLSTTCRCTNLDDAGAVFVGCSPCYGAPPARLERLARAA